MTDRAAILEELAPIYDELGYHGFILWYREHHHGFDPPQWITFELAERSLQRTTLWGRIKRWLGGN